jgi:hypothetical protein
MSVKNLKLEKQVKELLQGGKYPKEISEILGYSYGNILKIYKALGGKLEGSGGKNRKVTKNPFDNSATSQYWIGYFAADGNLSKVRNAIAMGLKDIDMIKLFRDFIEPSLTIYYKTNPAGSLIGTVSFQSPEIWNYLNNLGITPAKSKTLKYLGEFNWDFIRGVFDGDGSISKQEPKITTGSYLFKTQLEQFFKDNGLTYTTHIKGNNIYDVYIRSNSRFLFFDKMYSDSNCVKLERKYEKYRAALKKFRVRNIG